MKETTSEIEPPTILIVDDEPTLRMGFEFALKTEGYHIETASDGDQALQVIAENGAYNYAAMVLDMRMPGKDGIEVLRELSEKNTMVPTILASAFIDSPTAIVAIDLGVVDFLRKPITPVHIRDVVEKVIKEERQFLDTQSSVEKARCLLRRGDIETALEALNEIGENDQTSSIQLWKFITAHLIACHKNGGAETEFASSHFYTAADLLPQIAHN